MSEATTTAPESDAPRNVEEAIVYVRERCPYVRKQVEVRTGGGGTFKAAGIDDYLEKLVPEINKAKIVITPIGVEEIKNDVIEVGQKKTLMYRFQGRFSYRITHATSRTRMEDPVVVLGEATDTLDKAMSKAGAYALKACLRQTFLVETGEEERGPVEPTNAEHAMFTKALEAVRNCEDQSKFDNILSYARKSNFSEAELGKLNAAWSAKSNPRQNGNGHRQPENVEF